MAEVVLVNPKFEPSFWGMEYALPFLGKRAHMPPASLPLLAALTPPGHAVTLADENVEPLDFDRLARADLVGLTGMHVQRRRMREILTELKRRGAFTVVGGPWVTVQEDDFGDLADVIFVGEAEDTWPLFLDEWRRGRHRRRYEQDERTDMTRVPAPRLDLLPMGRYAVGSVQFSRGCPFRCEFCDIIVTFGRRPRLKTSAQILAEVEALRAHGVELAFIVDDNLIGNKRAIKPILRDLIAWQEARGYPLLFFTEASLDLAEDDELLGLMADANITAVFVGIESPNEESLVEAKKLQNVRAGSGILERVGRIQRAGLEVWCGMIVGFDHDGPDIFDAQREFITRAAISNAMVGMLAAIPKTPLHARLAAAGRLDTSDEPESGTNVIPLRMGARQLREGYARVLADLYEPKAYFDRVEDLFLGRRLAQCQAQARNWRRRPWGGLWKRLGFLARAAGLFGRLLWGVPDTALRREYLRRLGRFVGRCREPTMILMFAVKCAMHCHYHRFARQMQGSRARVVNTY